MRNYVIRRIVLLIPTLFIVSVVVFLTIRLIPGSVVDAMIGEMGSQGKSAGINREQLEHELGLDVPIYTQYGRWLGGIILHGDFGDSLRQHKPVISLIIPKIPATFELSLLAILFGLIISVPIGIYSAIRQESLGDYFGRSISIIFISVPSFWVATIFLIYPAIWWKVSPSIQYIPFSTNPLGNLGMMIAPSFILGMSTSGYIMRFVRTMMLEVLRQDYVRTAWAKGLRERTVVLRHVLKNAAIPVVTIIGMQIPMLIGGDVIIERIFVIPGIGRLILDSLSYRDYTLVSGINLIVAMSVVVLNLVVDVTYGFLDPRIRYR